MPLAGGLLLLPEVGVGYDAAPTFRGCKGAPRKTR